MEEEEDGESVFGGGFPPPFFSRASFITTSISPSPRRLSSNFSEPNRPIPSARRLSWVNLQGKLVNAEEASCSKAFGGSLSKEEGLAWDLFSPIHRILIVAVVAVATSDSNKSRQLQRSRDEVLLSMQQKCGCCLCDHHQLNTLAMEQHIYNLQRECEEMVATIKELSVLVKATEPAVSKRDSLEIGSCEDEMFKFKPQMIGDEQDERRMSVLSELASSVTSAADFQRDSLEIGSCEDEMFKFKPQMIGDEQDEQDERRMSVLSELASSVTSAADFQMDSLEIGSCEDEMFKFKPQMIGDEQDERRMSVLSDLASSVTSAADFQRDSLEIGSCEDEMFKFKPQMIGDEQDERRMSVLSDLASSVTSAADSQHNELAIEQDVDTFLSEYDQKDAVIAERDATIKEKDAIIKENDATIKELLAVVKATDAVGSQRVTDLEELVRRKNKSITRLKKDMAVLEQNVVHLTRLRRPSTASTLTIKELPMMIDNLIYDMISSSPSSSDSDSTIENRTRASIDQEHQETPTPQDVAAKRILQTPSEKPPMSLPKSTYRPPRSRPVSPLTENSMNQRRDSPSGDLVRNRRRIQSGSKDSAQSKGWV